MKPFCAAVDWGTSRFRLWILAEDGAVLHKLSSDEGLQFSAKIGFSKILEDHLNSFKCLNDLPVIICGMAGSRSGWKEANYLKAPVELTHIVENSVKIANTKRDIRILPGIAQHNANSPDVMRGEETQLFGMLFDKSNIVPTGTTTFCMPGTHSKWVTFENTRLQQFATFMTGELFALLSEHSVLKLSLSEHGVSNPTDPVFLKYVNKALSNPHEISTQLFSIRSSHLLGFTGLEAGHAALSGSLIGLELAGAFSKHGKSAHVILMASGSLGDLYAAALKECNVEVTFCDAENAGRIGLYQAAKILW